MRIPVDPEKDIPALEAGGVALMRDGDSTNGLRLLALALLIRNMQGVFACDIYESAGMAEVVELRSRKAPCS